MKLLDMAIGQTCYLDPWELVEAKRMSAPSALRQPTEAELLSGQMPRLPDMHSGVYYLRNYGDVTAVPDEIHRVPVARNKYGFALDLSSVKLNCPPHLMEVRADTGALPAQVDKAQLAQALICGPPVVAAK